MHKLRTFHKETAKQISFWAQQVFEHAAQPLPDATGLYLCSFIKKNLVRNPWKRIIFSRDFFG